MLGTRYEEHTYAGEKLPFLLSTDIERTPFSCTHEANWHETLEIQRCTGGKGYVLLDGEKFDVAENDIVVMNSHVIHYTCAAERMKYTCLIIDSRFCKQADIDHTALWFEPYFRSTVFECLFDELETLYKNPASVCRVARLQGILLKMLIELMEHHAVEKQGMGIGNHSFEIVKETIKFIRQNSDRKLSLDEISRHILTDKFRLSREFKQATGQTIVQYTNRYRCQKAMGLISDGVAVTDAATRCGFQNMSFFAKTFRRYTGSLPSKYKPL